MGKSAGEISVRTSSLKVFFVFLLALTVTALRTSETALLFRFYPRLVPHDVVS